MRAVCSSDEPHIQDWKWVVTHIYKFVAHLLSTFSFFKCLAQASVKWHAKGAKLKLKLKPGSEGHQNQQYWPRLLVGYSTRLIHSPYQATWPNLAKPVQFPRKKLNNVVGLNGNWIWMKSAGQFQILGPDPWPSKQILLWRMIKRYYIVSKSSCEGLAGIIIRID